MFRSHTHDDFAALLCSLISPPRAGVALAERAISQVSRRGVLTREARQWQVDQRLGILRRGLSRPLREKETDGDPQYSHCFAASRLTSWPPKAFNGDSPARTWPPLWCVARPADPCNSAADEPTSACARGHSVGRDWPSRTGRVHGQPVRDGTVLAGRVKRSLFLAVYRHLRPRCPEIEMKNPHPCTQPACCSARLAITAADPASAPTGRGEVRAPYAMYSPAIPAFPAQQQAPSQA